jgi:hypothetical protein
MTEPASSVSRPAAPAPPSSGGSPVRLLVLIGVLALAVGAWFYDYSYAGPGSESKYEEIQKMVDEKNAKGVKDGGRISSKDVEAVVGFPATFVVEKPDYTVEWYCWWGKIPVLSTWKRYITVVYQGDPRHFNTHHKNEPPPEESLPGYQPPPSVTPEVGGQLAAPTIPGGDLPGGMEGGAGPGKGKKSGGGEEASKGDTPADAAPAEGDKPAEAKTEEAKPEEAKPAEAKPDETKPADEKPADAPKGDDKPNA